MKPQVGYEQCTYTVYAALSLAVFILGKRPFSFKPTVALILTAATNLEPFWINYKG